MGRRSRGNDGLTIVQGVRFLSSRSDDDAPRHDELGAKRLDAAADWARRQTGRSAMRARVADRVVHATFGHGVVLARSRNVLEIYFLDVGIKKVVDSFVTPKDPSSRT